MVFMTKSEHLPDEDIGGPLPAPGNYFVKVLRKTYNFLASVRLALVLLITILLCCVAGVTVLRGEQAWSLIFNTLWFNGLFVLLVLNVAFCFFGRIWGRKVTLISLGMILFHISFVAMLGGVIYNSLFYFRGTIRLTEGETLPSGDLQSYDAFDHGCFFAFSKLKGETTLIKMHRDYSVDGADKQVAYEVAVGEGGSKKQGLIYVTHKLDNNGFDYFRDKEGYSLLIMLYNSSGKELYGAHVPLQSLRQKDETYLYTTGTKESPGPLPFPQDPLKPLFGLQVAYRPSLLKGRERAGEAFYQVWTLRGEDPGPGEHAAAEGKAAIGNRVNVGKYYLEAKEVRYWVGMNVRYEPGKPIVLTSLWVGLGGMILTFFGRMRRNRIEEKVV
jgi:cytochrome c biogenesis protein ResB